MRVNREVTALGVLLVFALPSALGEGVLSVGTPAVQGNAVTVPVYLEGSVDSGVAALDFTFHYDPSVLVPNGVRTGDAAIAAGKGVQYNMTSPGEYVVMMFGLNQSTMENGKIADISLRRVGAAAAETNIAIDGTTLASLAGQTIASRGSSATLQLSASPADDSNPQDPNNPPNTEPGSDPTPTDENEPPAPPTDDTTAPASEPTDTTVPSVSNPQSPASNGKSTVPTGVLDTGRPTGSRALNASRSDDAASRLSQLDRMAREFAQKRAGIPSPVATEDGATGAAPAASGSTETGTPASAPEDSHPGVAPLLAEGNTGEVRQMASLANVDPVGAGNDDPPARAAESGAKPKRGFFADRRVWVLGAFFGLLMAGLVARKRLFS